MGRHSSIVILSSNYRVVDNRVLYEAARRSRKVYIVSFLDRVAFSARNKTRSLHRLIFELESILDMNVQAGRKLNTRVMTFLSEDLIKTLRRLVLHDNDIRTVFMGSVETPFYRSLASRAQKFCTSNREKWKLTFYPVLDRTVLSKPARTLQMGTPYKRFAHFSKRVLKSRRLRKTPFQIKKDHRYRFTHSFCPIELSQGPSSMLVIRGRDELPEDYRLKDEISPQVLLRKLIDKKPEIAEHMLVHGGRTIGLSLLKSPITSKKGIHIFLEFGCISWREYWGTLTQKKKEEELERIFWLNAPVHFLSDSFRKVPKSRQRTRLIRFVNKDSVLAGKTGHLFFDVLIRKLHTTGYLTARERAVLVQFVVESGHDFAVLDHILITSLLDYNRVITGMMWHKVLSKFGRLDFRAETRRINLTDIRLYFYDELGRVSPEIIHNWYERSREVGSWPNPT